VPRLTISNFVAYNPLTFVQIILLIFLYMTTFRPILSTNEIYHLFNRSIGKEEVLKDKIYLRKILKIVNYYRFRQRISLSDFNNLAPNLQQDYLKTITINVPLIDIFVFSFMPNHYHFLAKQLQDKGISLFLSNIQNSFAKNYNLINDRNGSLFDHSFKAKRIANSEEFIHVSRYIHINHVTAGIISFEQLLTYSWSSLPVYLASGNPQGSLHSFASQFINTKSILDHFKTPEKYLKFLKNNVNYQRKLHKIKRLLLD